jgi:hypothetical protein
MNVQNEPLDDAIVLALKTACSEGRQEVAEHLLLALEAMDKPCSQRVGIGARAALIEAYDYIAAGRPE